MHFDSVLGLAGHAYSLAQIISIYWTDTNEQMQDWIFFFSYKLICVAYDLRSF